MRPHESPRVSRERRGGFATVSFPHRCFSSQYYMMMTVQVNGIMMFIFGMQMMVQAQYNVFGDQMMPFIFGADAAS